jgi:hypothetical protein
VRLLPDIFAGFVTCGCTRTLVQKGTSRIYNGMFHSETNCYDLPVTITRDNTMEFTTYVRKPFIVEAVEITKDNIEELSKFIGDIKEKEDGTKYILVDPRLVPNVDRVYVGYFMTKMGQKVRCFSRKIFRDQFVVKDESIQPWLDFLASNGSDEVPEAVTPTV